MIVLDSGFVVMKYIISLKKLAVYSISLIKKIRNNPEVIHGKAIEFYIADKEVVT